MKNCNHAWSEWRQTSLNEYSVMIDNVPVDKKEIEERVCTKCWKIQLSVVGKKIQED